jgi:hypothetical protein
LYSKVTIAALVVALAGLLGVSVAIAQSTPSASRTLPASVEPGGQVAVTVSVSNYGPYGSLVETMPAGFSFVSTTHDGHYEQSGQQVTFALFGESSVSYTVTASSEAGAHRFSGTLTNSDGDDRPVGGKSQVSVSTPPPAATATPTPTPTPRPPTSDASASRTLPASVGPGGRVTVRVSASDYGSYGSLEETLPAGFSFVSTTHDGHYEQSGQGGCA